MAQLSDIPKILRSVGPFGFIGRVWRELSDDNLLVWAAAVAYSWLFAIFPFVVFLMTLLPYLPEGTKTNAKNEIQAVVYRSMPKQAADTIWDNVSFILSRRHGGLLGIGLILTLWAASGGINMTITAVDKCYEIDNGRPFYKQRPMAIGLTTIVAVLVLALLILLPIGTVAIRWIERNGITGISGPLLWTWQILRFPLAVLLMFATVNLLYYFGPSIKQKYVFFTPGAVFVVIVWMLLAVAFRFYVDRYGKYNETYGTVGGVAILLILFYFDAVVLLIGAEINSEIDFEVLKVPRGSKDFTLVHEPPAQSA
ncbi:MAG: YihY/virulence factor BrkB family protein [Planctomycetota bacterium]|nr:YihY/virulence factor BrkB family protein [Planctomycetota bacterium]